jgi:tRNA(Ile)-lysidine synthase
VAERTHPPTLLTAAKQLIRRAQLFGRGDRVLAACSGGPDSMALLHALALLRRTLGHEVAACGVDHGLRPEAAAELALAAELAAAHGVSFVVLRVDLAAGSNLQARARTARHAVLQAEATRVGATAIALGHHADDRAETFLLRLLRAAGPAGLACMPPRAAGVGGDTPLVRPLLDVRRTRILEHLGRHGVRFADDPSNADRRFLRVRVRRELVPLLEDLAPGIVPQLGALADMLATDDAWAGLGRDQRQAVERVLRRGEDATLVLPLRNARELSLRIGTRK